jgi:hypothetical protein
MISTCAREEGWVFEEEEKSGDLEENEKFETVQTVAKQSMCFPEDMPFAPILFDDFNCFHNISGSFLLTMFIIHHCKKTRHAHYVNKVTHTIYTNGM